MNTWAPYTQPASDSFYYQYSADQDPRHPPDPPAQPVDRRLRRVLADAGVRQAGGEGGRPRLRVPPRERDRAAELLPRAAGHLEGHRRGHAHRTLRAVPVHLRAGRRRLRGARCVPGRLAVEIIPAENKIIGICRFNHGGVPDEFRQLLRDRLRPAVRRHGMWTPDDVQAGEAEARRQACRGLSEVRRAPEQAGRAARWLPPSSARSRRCAISSARSATRISTPSASGRRRRWNEALGRARIEGGTEDQRRTFYSALYRSIIFPHRFYEYNEQGQPVYFSPYDGKVHEGVLYTDTGFWDTFRAAHPLYNLLFPEISAEILQGLLNAYDQSGWLPSWSSPGHRDCMIGNHAFSLLADGWVKGIRSFDAQQGAWPPWCTTPTRRGRTTAGPSAATAPSSTTRSAMCRTPATGRTQLRRSHRQDAGIRLRRFLRRLARAAPWAARPRPRRSLRKAMNYTNVFDAKTGFVRGRKADGSWCEPFDPDRMGRAVHRRQLLALDVERVP